VGVEAVHQLRAAVEPAVRKLEGNAADLHAVEGQAGAAVLLEEIEDRVAFAEGIEEGRDSADVDGVGREPHQVRRQPLQLGKDHSDVGGAWRDRDAEELLHGDTEALIIGRRRNVIHPVGMREALREGHGLEELFGAAVEVADDRFGLHDLLAVELHLDSQHPVGCRVLGTEVDLHLLDVEKRLVGTGHAVPPSSSSASSGGGPPPGG
jgi:hypothetical protein